MGGETEANVSGWTVDTLGAHLNRRIMDLQSMLDERYQTQTKAVDAAFLAQQTAMQTALTSAERAVQTALISAEKAVVKAEVSSEKRFEAVNEFRGQLADQASTFVSRAEADARAAEAVARLTALSEKFDNERLTMAERVRQLENRLTSRLDLNQGQDVGKVDALVRRRQETAQMISILGAVVAVVGVAVAIILGFGP